MSYAERAYFENDHCHHVAAWEERARLGRKRVEAIKALDRRASRRYH